MWKLYTLYYLLFHRKEHFQLRFPLFRDELNYSGCIQEHVHL